MLKSCFILNGKTQILLRLRNCGWFFPDPLKLELSTSSQCFHSTFILVVTPWLT
jgi:hypothetical protein